MDSPLIPERNHRRVDILENGFTPCSPSGSKEPLSTLTPTTHPSTMTGTQPPTLPVRPSQQQISTSYPNSTLTNNKLYPGVMGGYGGYGGSYGGYGGSYGGAYGGYSPMMNRLGVGGGPMSTAGDGGLNRSSLVQSTENNVISAFQSVENIIQAFSSVSMMLESTYFAVYNSFRAVISVADQFTLLKQQFIKVLKLPVRLINYIIWRISVLLHVRSSEDLTWSNILNNTSNSSVPGTAAGGSRTTSPWPIVMFFVIFIGGPLLLYRWLSSLIHIDQEKNEEWAHGNVEHVVARAEYDFITENQDEISFKAGDIIRIAPKDKQPQVRGWLLGATVVNDDDVTIGYIPANYVTILGKKRGAVNNPQPTNPEQ